jgi:hypothetical protein
MGERVNLIDVFSANEENARLRPFILALADCAEVLEAISAVSILQHYPIEAMQSADEMLEKLKGLVKKK